MKPVGQVFGASYVYHPFWSDWMIQRICPDQLMVFVFERFRVSVLGVIVRSMVVPAGFDCSTGIIPFAHDSVRIPTSHFTVRIRFE